MLRAVGLFVDECILYTNRSIDYKYVYRRASLVLQKKTKKKQKIGWEGEREKKQSINRRHDEIHCARYATKETFVCAGRCVLLLAAVCCCLFQPKIRKKRQPMMKKTKVRRKREKKTTNVCMNVCLCTTTATTATATATSCSVFDVVARRTSTLWFYNQQK